MRKKELMDKLNEVSERYGRRDLDTEINNIATKVHTLLKGGCGKLTGGQDKELRKIGESVLGLAGPEPRHMIKLKARYAGSRAGAGKGEKEGI